MTSAAAFITEIQEVSDEKTDPCVQYMSRGAPCGYSDFFSHNYHGIYSIKPQKQAEPHTGIGTNMYIFTQAPSVG